MQNQYEDSLLPQRYFVYQFYAKKTMVKEKRVITIRMFYVPYYGKVSYKCQSNCHYILFKLFEGNNTNNDLQDHITCY